MHLCTVLGTNDANTHFNEWRYRNAITSMVHDFQGSSDPPVACFLVSPPPLWVDCIFGCMLADVINRRLPVIIGELALSLGCAYINNYQRFRDHHIEASVSCDGCHVYPAGQQFMAEGVIEALQPSVRMVAPASPPMLARIAEWTARCVCSVACRTATARAASHAVRSCP